MKNTSLFVITISRQLGCGGSYIGQLLAKDLDVCLLDRDIIKEAAKSFSLLEADVAERDEKLESFWGSVWQNFSVGYSGPYTMPIVPQTYLPTDRDLFDAEVAVMKHMTAECSAVVIGRCGCHVLRDIPNHVSVYLYADFKFRSDQIQSRFNLSQEEADVMIKKTDLDRGHYFERLTGKEWSAPENYHLMIDSGKLGFDATEKVILDYVKRCRFVQSPKILTHPAFVKMA